MLRFLLCISCCSAPPPRDQSAKRVRRASSKQLPNGAPNEASSEQQVESVEAIEKEHLLTNQKEKTSENYGTDASKSQGKLTPLFDETTDPAAAKDDEQSMLEETDSVAIPASAKLQRANAIDQSYHGLLRNKEHVQSTSQDDQSTSFMSSVDIGPFTESYSTTASQYRGETRQQLLNEANALGSDQLKQIPSTARNDVIVASKAITAGLESSSRGAASRDIPSTTKIGDYARIEYSPVEDLESVTTMSYSRIGSERDGTRSQADSTLSRQNSLKVTTSNAGTSRRSSQGGIESTSISIDSQLSNEQFQQNLTNMLELVNTNYQNLGEIGLPLGPIDGLQTETTKTSPETPGAALTSASQDSLSDNAFEESNLKADKSIAARASASTGAALIANSMERSNLSEELAEFSQPAPLATGEDSDGNNQQRTKRVDKNSAGRVGSPQSIATTTSGGLTNPTPTPSEMSGGSGKKKRLKAKALLKKLRPGNKKKDKEGPK